MIICTECKKKVKRTHPNQKTCSEVCSKKRAKRNMRRLHLKYKEMAKEGKGPLIKKRERYKNGYEGKRITAPENKTRILNFSEIRPDDLYRHVFNDVQETTKLAEVKETCLEPMTFKLYFDQGRIECYRR